MKHPPPPSNGHDTLRLAGEGVLSLYSLRLLTDNGARMRSCSSNRGPLGQCNTRQPPNS